MAVGTANTANAGQLAGTPNALSKEQAESRIPAQQSALKRTVTNSADGATAEGRDPDKVIAVAGALEQTPTQDSDAKTYYHRFAGSGTHLPDGTHIIFAVAFDDAGNRIGKFTTSDEAAIKHLDAIADKPGSQVYTVKRIPQDSAQVALAQAAADTKKNANELGANS